MNKKLSILCAVLLTTVLGVVAANAQTDLSTRKAVYFTGAKTGSIDLKNDVYVAAAATLSLSAELRVSCDHNVCEFNVGVIASRSGTGPLSTKVRIQTDGSTFSAPVVFGDSEKSKEVILPIKLKLGKNQIAVSIDPDNATPESNESNNSFTGTVLVSWKRSNPGNKN